MRVVLSRRQMGFAELIFAGLTQDAGHTYEGLQSTTTEVIGTEEQIEALADDLHEYVAGGDLEALGGSGGDARVAMLAVQKLRKAVGR